MLARARSLQREDEASVDEINVAKKTIKEVSSNYLNSIYIKYLFYAMAQPNVLVISLYFILIKLK